MKIKLSGTLYVNISETKLRIFFNDNMIACYTCKSARHTSMSCYNNFMNIKNPT